MIYCPLESVAGGWWLCPQCGWLYYGPRAPRRNCPGDNGESRVTGLGDKLHDLLRERLGVDMIAGCNCRTWIERMNHWGSQGCRENLNRIVNALISEARRRNWKIDGHPVLSAIARAGDLTPLGDYCARAWARRLVLEVIETCEVEP